MYLSDSQFVHNKLHSAVMRKLFRCLEIGGIHVEAGRIKFTQKKVIEGGGKNSKVLYHVQYLYDQVVYYRFFYSGYFIHQNHLCDTTCNQNQVAKNFSVKLRLP